METSITYLKEQFQLKDPDIRSYSPLTLAYIGDGIYPHHPDQTGQLPGE